MSGTGGGWTGTSRGRRRLGLLGALAVALIIGTVDVASTLHDFGDRFAWWEPWIWEYSSIAYWMAAIPLLWHVTRGIRPPRLAGPVVALAYLALTVPVSAAHLATLAALRPPIYAMLGSHYTPDWSWAQIAYEYRKDLLVTLLLIGAGVVVDLWALAAEGALPASPAVPAPPYRLEIRDGPRIHWLAPAEIERVEAAGNYVELYGPRGTLLHRATLTAVEAELAPHGFVRIPRSRLVRRDAVTAVAGTASGDFEATLGSGTVVAGSRRFRAALA